MTLRSVLILCVFAVACSDDSNTPVVGLPTTNNATNGSTNNSPNNLPTNNGRSDGGVVDMGGASDASFESDANDMTVGPPENPIEGVGAAVLIQEGFQFTEGPRWFVSADALRFTDIPASTIYELGADGNITTFRNPSGGANGLAFEVDDNLLAAEHQNRQISITVDGQPETLVNNYQGQKFNSPNDLVLHGDRVYFTDPPYGLGNRAREVSFNGLYRYEMGTQTLVAEWEGDAASTRPNGVVVSPDGRTLYLADTMASKVYEFSVADDGSLSDQLDFAEVPSPDGMAIDVSGNLYVAASDGIQVFAPDGTKWGTIAVGRQPSNCAFGGQDHKTLYITAQEGLYSVDLFLTATTRIGGVY